MACLVPEVPFDENSVVQKLLNARKEGKRSMIVVIAEGCENPDGTPYAETFTQKCCDAGLEARLVRPAHTVRGATPTMKDRVVATEMGRRAVDLLVEGKSDLVFTVQDGKIITKDINVALIADRKYKNKLKPGDLDQFTKEQLAEIDDLVARKDSATKALAELANGMSFLYFIFQSGCEKVNGFFSPAFYMFFPERVAFYGKSGIILISYFQKGKKV